MYLILNDELGFAIFGIYVTPSLSLNTIPYIAFGYKPFS